MKIDRIMVCQERDSQNPPIPSAHTDSTKNKKRSTILALVTTVPPKLVKCPIVCSFAAMTNSLKPSKAMIGISQIRQPVKNDENFNIKLPLTKCCINGISTSGR